MPFDPAELDAELASARVQGLDAVCASAERSAKLPAGLLLAVASRETGCRDVVGDGGHGRGVFQIDDRSHADWLAAHGAGGPGGVPPVAEAAGYAARLLAGGLEYGRAHGVAESDLLKFALSAYNAGSGGALGGYREGDSDRATTGGDYGADVLARLEFLHGRLTGAPASPAHPLLRPGARGDAVRELKRSLAGWFAAHPPAPRFARNAVYGPAAVEAVQAFQRASGLDPDGIVGERTWGALLAPAAGPPRQAPPLPASVSFPDALYPHGEGWLGLQPWIEPQVLAICERFGLTATAGWGGHPPHAPRSDHGWGGACDLAGPLPGMVECTNWADRYRADPYRAGMVFRWVGGPAHDASGVEPGHSDHVHLSWYRLGPATTIFGTPEFA